MIELVALALSLGALLYHTFTISLGLISMISFMLVIFFCTYSLSRKGIYRISSLGIFLILGAALMYVAQRPVDKDLFGRHELQGRVISVERRLDQTILIVKENLFKERIRVSLNSRAEILPNDTVYLSGAVVSPKDFITDTGRIFAYKEYLGSKDIVGIMQDAEIVRIEKGNGGLVRLATNIRHHMAEVLGTYVSFPTDGVIAGMLVGYQGGLMDETKDLFRDTGVLHVLVLSGYNIMLLAGFMALLLKRVPFHIRIAITVILIALLVLISGSGVASVRAGIMGSIALLANVALRGYQPLRALLLTYIFFLLISPLAIFSDPGLHLSFLATFFMIQVLPRVIRLFRFVPQTKYVSVRELIALAVSIPLFMLPYTMYFSGSLPLATIPANILLALVIPILTLFGIGIVFLSWIAPLATLLGIIVSTLGNIVLSILVYLSTLPILQTPALSWWGVLCIYCAIIVLLFYSEIKTYAKWIRNSFQLQTNSIDS